MKTKRRLSAIKKVILISLWPFLFIPYTIILQKTKDDVSFSIGFWIVLILLCLVLSFFTYNITYSFTLKPLEFQEKLEAHLSKNGYKEIYMIPSETMLYALIKSCHLHLFAKLVENNIIKVSLQDKNKNEIYFEIISNPLYFFNHYKFDKDKSEN